MWVLCGFVKEDERKIFRGNFIPFDDVVVWSLGYESFSWRGVVCVTLEREEELEIM
jgi:hypothetical protein